MRNDGSSIPSKRINSVDRAKHQWDKDCSSSTLNPQATFSVTVQKESDQLGEHHLLSADQFLPSDEFGFLLGLLLLTVA